MSTHISLNNITKKFGDFTALDGVSVDIEQGEFVTLLGPSGCGKTTLLRIIAGFLEPNEGTVSFNGNVVNDVPPNKRNTAMCFQSYALFPHKNVYENIRFGLRMHKVPKEDHEERVEEAMAMVNLEGLGKRKPYELSGGQQQRVALARAIVLKPDLLLFDEPLSNLDAKLREKVRVEIRDLQKKLGITTIYVTHDQSEALAISDTIISMNKGEFMQNSSPVEIYDEPKNKFVADFIGNANIMPCELKKHSPGKFIASCDYGELLVDAPYFDENKTSGFVCIRPEDVFPVVDDKIVEEGMNIIEGVVENYVYLGEMLQLQVTIAKAPMSINVYKEYVYEVGSKASLEISSKRIRLLEE